MIDLTKIVRRSKRRGRKRRHTPEHPGRFEDTHLSPLFEADTATRDDIMGGVDTLEISVLTEEHLDRISDDEETFDVDERLHIIGGFGRYQRRVLLIVGMWMYGGSSVWCVSRTSHAFHPNAICFEIAPCIGSIRAGSASHAGS